jgi:hypothetical protein
MREHSVNANGRKRAVADVSRLRALTRSGAFCEESVVDGRRLELPTSALRTRILGAEVLNTYALFRLDRERVGNDPTAFNWSSCRASV